MTYRDALQNGYKDAECTYQRGYVSRKADPMEAEVHTAGGSKAGRLYVLQACRHSTQYCYRQYLTKDE